MNYTVVDVHIDTIRHGDTIIMDGGPKTVSSKYIKSGFMGTTLYGDSYKLGTEPVKLCVFAAGGGE